MSDIDTLRKLKNEGFEPKRILDIGASNGSWSNSVSSVFPTAKYFLIEGNTEHEQNLINSGFPFKIEILGSENKEVVFYKSVNDKFSTGNSIYRENTSYFKDVIEEKRNMVTLDSLNLGDDFDLVKIDTQGAEIDIVKGGINTLKNTKYIIAECPCVQYNQGAPSTFEEVFSFFQTIGFKVVEKVQDHHVEGRHVQSDFLFERI